MRTGTPKTIPKARRKEREWTHLYDPPGFHLQQTIKTVAKAKALLKTNLTPRDRRQAEQLLELAEESRDELIKQLTK